ncbi:MAG: hypothetical protein L0211_10145 [Planctomycetaceae bacterium]|nr:hypothetical protein [Planctomycetaceae bacterium]
MRKLVPLHQYLLAAAALVLWAGCGRQSPAPAPSAGTMSAPEQLAEPRLTEQMAAIERGESTRILVERELLGDQDLVALGKLTNLTDLLLDNADSEFHEAGIAALAELPNLQHLRIRGRGIGNGSLREISKIKTLRILNLPQGRFDDAGLELLAELPKLESLRFGSSLVTDAGMKSLARFPAIERLHLIDVPITDAGLAELGSIERLQSLYVDGGTITDAGWDKLFRARPRLHVHINQQHHDRDPNRHAH